MTIFNLVTYGDPSLLTHLPLIPRKDPITFTTTPPTYVSIYVNYFEQLNMRNKTELQILSILLGCDRSYLRVGDLKTYIMWQRRNRTVRIRIQKERRVIGITQEDWFILLWEWVVKSDGDRDGRHSTSERSLQIWRERRGQGPWNVGWRYCRDRVT